MIGGHFWTLPHNHYWGTVYAPFSHYGKALFAYLHLLENQVLVYVYVCVCECEWVCTDPFLSAGLMPISHGTEYKPTESANFEHFSISYSYRYE